jgi:crotonobetainyl-CoA:carnitine CoA-transferase CaiB-like acyl-CoA transferase
MPATDLLGGVRVLDLGIWRPAPFAAQLLAEMGAAVTKVEPPGGDPMRMFPALYRTLNERKHIIELDLKADPGRAEVWELIRETDVVVEGFRPGVADRLGVGAARARELNPSVVYCSISGYGQHGPLAAVTGHDLNYQAWAGFLASRAPEIHRPGVPVGDLAGGTYAAMAICAAVVARDRTGVGRRIDVSMADVLFSWAAPEIGGELASTDDPGSAFPAYGTFACTDGFVTLGIVSEQPFWEALCDVLDLDAIRSLDVAARARRGAELRGRLEEEIAGRGRDELSAALVSRGVPAAPVLPAEDARDAAHFIDRGVIHRRDDGSVGLDHPVQFD